MHKSTETEKNNTLTCFNMTSREIKDARRASSAAVEGFRIGEPPSCNVNNASSFLICCNSCCKNDEMVCL